MSNYQKPEIMAGHIKRRLFKMETTIVIYFNKWQSTNNRFRSPTFHTNNVVIYKFDAYLLEPDNIGMP